MKKIIMIGLKKNVPQKNIQDKKDKENEETWFTVNFATKMTFTSTVVVVGCTS